MSFDLNLWTYKTTFIKFRILSYYYTPLSALLDLFTYHIQNTLQEQVFYYTTLHSLSTNYNLLENNEESFNEYQ